jgi:hypothetical protein
MHNLEQQWQFEVRLEHLSGPSEVKGLLCAFGQCQHRRSLLFFFKSLPQLG